MQLASPANLLLYLNGWMARQGPGAQIFNVSDPLIRPGKQDELNALRAGINRPDVIRWQEANTREDLQG